MNRFSTPSRRLRSAPLLLSALLGAASLGAQPLGLEDVAEKQALPPSPWASLPEEWRRELTPFLESQIEAGEIEHYSDAYDAWRERGRAASPGAPGSWSQEFFDRILTRDGRRVLLAMVAKLRAERIWEWVGTLGYMDVTGAGAAMDVLPRYGDSHSVRRRLEDLDYGTWYFADKGHVWGLRSPETGAQLHLRGPEPGATVPDVNIHLDLHNPGRTLHPLASLLAPALPLVDYAVRGGAHAWEDLRHRGETHLPDPVLDALRGQGLDFPRTE